jgi:hypothetical protein
MQRFHYAGGFIRMIYEVYKIIDGEECYEGKGDINYLKRILLHLGTLGFSAEEINIIIIQ